MRTLLTALLALCLCVGAPAAWADDETGDGAGEIILTPADLPGADISVKSASDSVSKFQRVHVMAPLIGRKKDLIAIISDFESYRELFSAVAESRVLETGEDRTDVHFLIDLPWPIDDHWYDVRFDIKKSRGKMKFEMLQGQARRLFGESRVMGSDGMLLLDYQINFTTSYQLPAWLVKWAVSSVFQEMVNRTQARLILMQAPQAAPKTAEAPPPAAQPPTEAEKDRPLPLEPASLPPAPPPDGVPPAGRPPDGEAPLLQENVAPPAPAAGG